MFKNITAAAAIAVLSLVSCQKKDPNQTVAQQKLESAPAATTAKQEELPQMAKDFLATHFPAAQVAESKKDGALTTEFEAKLTDGTEIEFFKDGSLKSVKSPNKLPDGIVPQKIADYAKAQHPQNFVKEYSIEDKGQKIELDNDVEVKFDGAGNFVKVD